MNKLEKWLLISFAAALIAVGAALLLSRGGAAPEVPLRTILPGHSGRVTSLAFFPDGKTLVSAGMDDSLVHLWDVQSGRLLQTGGFPPAPVAAPSSISVWGYSVAVSPDGQKIFVGGTGSDYYLWDVSTGDLKTLVSSRQKGYSAVDFSFSGRTVAAISGAPSSSISIWDVETGDLLQTTNGESFAYSPDGEQLACAGMDGTIKVWNAGALIHTLKGHRGKANLASFSPDGKRIVSAGDDKTVKIWDAGSGSLIDTLEGHRGKVLSAVYSPDSKKIFSVGENAVKTWDAATGALINTIDKQIDFYLTLMFSPSEYLVKSVPNAVKIWDAATGALLYTLRHSSEQINWIAHSPDGSATEGTIAASNENGEILIWNLRDAEP